MMIEHTSFARSNNFVRWNTILSDQNVCLLSYNIMEEDLVKILLDQDDQANEFYRIISVFAWWYDPWSTLQMTLYIETRWDDRVSSTHGISEQNYQILLKPENIPFT